MGPTAPLMLSHADGAAAPQMTAATRAHPADPARSCPACDVQPETPGDPTCAGCDRATDRSRSADPQTDDDEQGTVDDIDIAARVDAVGVLVITPANAGLIRRLLDEQRGDRP